MKYLENFDQLHWKLLSRTEVEGTKTTSPSLIVIRSTRLLVTYKEKLTDSHIKTA